MNISNTQTIQTTQINLDFEPGLLQRHHNLLDCVAASVYRRGLSVVAIDLNESPGNLSHQISQDSSRKFGVDELELFIEKSKDFTPIYFLIEKFLNKPEVKSSAALAALPAMMAQLAATMKAAGLSQ